MTHKTASQIFREAAGMDGEELEESQMTDEEINRRLTVIDNIIKHFHSPYPLDESGRPIPPPPSQGTNKFKKRTKQKGGKRAKR